MFIFSRRGTNFQNKLLLYILDVTNVENLNWITAIMDEEALAQDETGIIWITLELNGDLWPSRHNLETLFGAQVLADHTRHEITPVEDGKHVGVANIQAGKEAQQEATFSRQENFKWSNLTYYLILCTAKREERKHQERLRIF